jgi:hypothetical protein
MRRSGAAALALWLFFAGSTAHAADYPFSGFFTMTPPVEDEQKSQLRCAYAFFIQGKDGSYVNYHLDLPRFVGSSVVRFVEYSRGSCSLDESGKIESCLAVFDSDPSAQGKTFIDVFRLSEPGVIDLFHFDGIAEARTFAAAGAGAQDAAGRYRMCSGFDTASMASYLTTERSTLSPDDLLKMTFPTPDDATMAIMTRVQETIRADKKE